MVKPGRLPQLFELVCVTAGAPACLTNSAFFWAARSSAALACATVISASAAAISAVNRAREARSFEMMGPVAAAAVVVDAMMVQVMAR